MTSTMIAATVAITKATFKPSTIPLADDSIAYGAHILEVLRDPEKVKPVNPDNDAVLPDEED